MDSAQRNEIEMLKSTYVQENSELKIKLTKYSEANDELAEENKANAKRISNL
jgi:hypothetical protein